MPAAKPALFCGTTTSPGCVLVGRIWPGTVLSVEGRPEVDRFSFSAV